MLSKFTTRNFLATANMRSKPPAKTPVSESPAIDPSDDPYMQLTTAYEYIRRGGRAEDFVDFEYKKYPFHIEHWDPESPNYVESPREEHRLKCSLNDHNDMLDQFKRDLKLQTQVMEAIQTLDRPYLREGTPGIDKNVYDTVKDYRDQKDLEVSMIEGNDEMNSYLQNEKAFINNTPFAVKVPKLSNEVEMEELQAHAPVTDHFHPDKGYKFDVETPYDERYPHVADRLGHPEIFLNPIESLLRIETDMAHPAHLDQPFIQTPRAEPNADLDFSAGEVIYEHPNSQEWIKFAFLNTNIACAYFGILYPIMTIFNSSTPLPFAQEESQVPPFKMMFTNFDYNGVLPIIYSALVATTFGVSNVS